MPEGVVKQTAKIFVMRMADGDGIFRQVTVQGTKISYDASTGQITGGTIASIRYDTIQDDGKTRTVVDSTSWAGLNSDAGVLADRLGHPFWNHIKTVTDSFARLDTLHEGVVRSHFDARESWFIGTDSANRLQGGLRDDAIDGGAGNDTLFGRLGDDSLTGGDGDDRLLGGAGNDVLTDTGGRRNTLSGGVGDDSMFGGTGNDQMSGDIGNDTFSGNGGTDLASGGRGADTFVFDAKAAGRLQIQDFALADDLLMFAGAATAKDAYAKFMDSAVQVGRHVEYTDGAQTMVLWKLRLSDLRLENFTGTDMLPDILS